MLRLLVAEIRGGVIMLRIFDTNINLLSEIDNFQSCIITRKYLGIETLEMNIPISANYVDTLQKYNIIHFGDRRVFEILHIELNENQSNMLKIIGYGFGKTLAKRITIPPTGQSYETATGSRDAIVKQYITNNIISPTDSSRAISYFANASTQAGTSITDKTRLQNLNDEVIRVLIGGGLGYFFDLDLINQKIIFDTYAGVDRSVNNTEENSTCIFSLDFDNIIEQNYIESLADAQTNLYVGGQGEGSARTIVQVGNKTGIERFETFIDARDTNDNNELTNRGLAEQNSGIASFEANVNPNSNLTYGTDYELGDIVTIQDRRLGLTFDNRITEAQEIYQQGQPFQLEITFGKKFPSFLNEIKYQKKKINKLNAI